MLIEKLEVKNFRSIRAQCLDCGRLVALLGRNGSGKSSFLYALDTFYDVSAPVTMEDFYNRETESPIEIRVTYGSLRDDEKVEFSSYIQNEKLIVTKRIEWENDRVVSRYYAATLQVPRFAEIRAIPSKSDRKTRWNALVEDPGELTGLGPKAKSAADVDRFMAEYESQHPELLLPVERIEQFFGPKNIGGGKLDKFTRYVLVPAVREASDEAIGRKGAIYQILDMIVLRKVNARKDVLKFKADFEKEVKALYCSDNLTELPDLGDIISQTLERFAPGCRLKLTWGEVKVPDIQLPEAIPTLIEDRFEGEVSRKGHGLQRALMLTLLQHLSTLVSAQPVDEEPSANGGTPEAPVPASVVGPDLIIAIEEPELYLHPSRCRYLSSVLHQLAEDTAPGNGSKNQVLFATHSPYFVDLRFFDQVRLVRKQHLSATTGPSVPQSVVTSLTLDAAALEMARICGASPDKFTRDSFRARAMSIMNTVVNEGFFADVAVVVEGPSEAGMLWRLQEILNMNWEELCVVVVPAGGKNNIDRPTVIFRGLSIPTYFVFDADSRHRGKVNQPEAEFMQRNRRYLCLAGADPQDFPETQVHEDWAVFGDELETELKEALGNQGHDLEAICDRVASELGYTESSHVIKNVEGAARFIEAVYEEGARIPVLEDIAKEAARLRNRVLLETA